MPWTISFHEAARVEADAQPVDIRARLERFRTLIIEHGPDKLPPKAAKHLRAELWELRLKGKDTIARAFYITRTGQRLIIVRIFTKKTQKTPPREIKLALSRAEEVP
jgi:phage-related protein